MITPNHGALTGLRVLDSTHALAGPFCSQVLADHGADVIKIEPPQGDFFRGMGPFFPDDKRREYGGLFQSCNRNKRSIVIDIKNPEGQKLFKELVKKSDALVENYRAGVLDKIGLGYETLKQINPRLVYTSIRGFGDNYGGISPYSKWPAFDIIAQAMGGWMSITGPDADHPTKIGGGLGDTVPGLFGAFGTLSAIWNAQKTGLGQYVDISMVDSVLAMSELITSQFGYAGVSPSPIGNGIPGLYPFGNFQAKDGMIVIAANHDPLWKDLCEVMGKEEYITDVRYATEEARWENKAGVKDIIEAFTMQYTKLELKSKMGGKVPFSPILTAKEIFTDPHFEARNMLPEVEHPGMDHRMVKVSNTPVKLSETPGGVRHRAPRLGEHTNEIMLEFGFGQSDINQMLEAKIIQQFKE